MIVSIVQSGRFSKFSLLIIFCTSFVVFLTGETFGKLQEGDIPELIKVKPVFFVPTDEKGPTEAQQKKLMKHLNLAQKSYSRMLKNRDTFQIETGDPLIVRGKGHLASYKIRNGSSTTISYEPLLEIFEKGGWNRFNCPYVLVIVIMNHKENFPAGAGRTFNQGYNSGGGLVYMSSNSLDCFFNFQGTLQHMLGHSFGLVKVKVYGYNMETNCSIMSFNENNYWDGFYRPQTPGILIPEDLRILDRNDKVFPDFFFDPAKDLPVNYKLHRTWTRLGLTTALPGQKDYEIKCTTGSRQLPGSTVSSIVRNLVLPKESFYSAKRMWHTEVTQTGWVNVTVTFPVPVALSKVGVHSQHHGKYHMAEGVKVEVSQDGGYIRICNQPIDSPDAYVSFPIHQGTTWRFSFRTGESKQVVIRALRFFSSETNEIFAPMYGYSGP